MSSVTMSPSKTATKKAVLLHGTDGTPDANWFPWLKAKLEAAGYEVWVPQLPDCHEPNRDTYGDFLFGNGYDFTDSLLIGQALPAHQNGRDGGRLGRWHSEWLSVGLHAVCAFVPALGF
jgi:hypothetical protein